MKMKNHEKEVWTKSKSLFVNLDNQNEWEWSNWKPLKVSLKFEIEYEDIVGLFEIENVYMTFGDFMPRVASFFNIGKLMQNY